MKLSDRVRPGSEAAPWVIEEIKRLEAELEAKAAPVGEREAFLLWLGIKPCGAAHDLAWDAWKAGAAHQRQHGEYGNAYQGAREDLAIWKRRALEAEARVRQQDQIIDQMGEDLNAINGPTFMGEPVLPRQQARKVVMPGRAEVTARYGHRTMGYAEGWNACLDEFARRNKGAGSHE